MAERVSPANAADRTTGGALPATANLGICWLAFASGSLDVIAFLTLDRVFASAMTGNAALLGIAVSDGDWDAASRPALALVGFVFGAMASSAATDPKAATSLRSAKLIGLLLFEATCLAVFALAWQTSGEFSDDVAQRLLILLCSFAMGVQGVAAKIVNAPGVNTIVFTSTLVAIVSSATNMLMRRHDGPQIRTNTLHQLSNFAAYGAGALAAGMLAWNKFGLLAWLPVAAVVFALVSFVVTREGGEVD